MINRESLRKVVESSFATTKAGWDPLFHISNNSIMEETRVPIQDALLYLWKLRNKIVNAEFELNKMIDMRRPLTRANNVEQRDLDEDYPDSLFYKMMIKRQQSTRGNCKVTAPMIANDPEQNKIDEDIADKLFLEIQESLLHFMASYTGIVISNNSGWKKSV